MSGLKSGSGDDLWDDEDGDDEEDEDPTDETATEADPEERSPAEEGPPARDPSGDAAEASLGPGGSDDGPGTDGGTDASEGAGRSPDTDDRRESSDQVEGTRPSTDTGGSSSVQDRGSTERPYIVRRAVRDKSVQFERDERLTFFVHRDVVDGERELVTELESTLGRDVPKFDVREAVYRAALRNREDVLDELLRMGYALED